MTDRPNILFISSDSMDGRVLGCMGHPAAHTPHMDRLASRGVLFTQAYCNSPQCCPSRASMWSGRYVHQVEAWNNFKGLEEGDCTFQDRLEAGGCRTQIVGKTDYSSGHHTLGARLTAWADPVGLKLRHDIGMDNIAWECDYPHSDSSWPTAPEELEKFITSVDPDMPDAEINKITYENACRWYSYDPFTTIPKEQATVAALRQRAIGHDVSIKSSETGRVQHSGEGISLEQLLKEAPAALVRE